MALVIAAIAMTVLELARDSADHLGVGLIPVVLVGLVLVFAALCHESKGRSQSLSVVSYGCGGSETPTDVVLVAVLRVLAPQYRFPVHQSREAAKARQT